jgi:hypothetical protein
MDSFLPGVVTALWLGILTSMSPCPLATNIAAISYIGRTVASPGKVFLTGLLYSLGRMITYLSLSNTAFRFCCPIWRGCRKRRWRRDWVCLCPLPNPGSRGDGSD